MYLHIILMSSTMHHISNTVCIFHLKFPRLYNSTLWSRPGVAVNGAPLFSSIIYPSVNTFSGKHEVFPQSRVSMEMS